MANFVIWSFLNVYILFIVLPVSSVSTVFLGRVHQGTAGDEITSGIQITSHSLYEYLSWFYTVSVGGSLETSVNQLKPCLNMA